VGKLRHRVQGGLVIAQNPGQTGDHEVAHGMACHSAIAAEAMLEGLAPQLAYPIVIG